MDLLRRILHPDSFYNFTGPPDHASNFTLGIGCIRDCGDPSPSAIPEGFIPDFFPPPPPTAAPFVNVNMTTAITSPKTHPHLTLTALVISSVLAAFFLLVTYYVLYLRIRAHIRRRRRTMAAAAITTPGGPGPSPDDDGEDEDAAFFNQDNGAVHHVWFIRTVGLEQPLIDSITVCPYKTGDGLIESTDCSVCLSEFQDGELVRLLPKCCHAFHLPCIDTWLRSHLNCPLCRAPIVAPALPPAAAPVEAAASSAAAAATVAPLGGSPDSAVTVAAVVGTEGTDTDGSDDGSVGDEEQHRALSSRMIFPVPEDREETEITEGSASRPGNNPQAPLPHMASLSVAEFGFRVHSDLGGSRIRRNLRDDDEWVTIDLGPDRGTQPARRSVSMDLSAMGAFLYRQQQEDEESGGNSQGAVSSRKAGLPLHPRDALPPTAAAIWMMKHGRDLKGGSNHDLHKQAPGMDRCSSTNSGAYIFSRLGRGRTRSHASILPL